MADLSDKLSEIDEALRTGQTASARKLLDAVLKGNIPRQFRWKVAALCRRSGVSEKAARLLHPYVRGSSARQAAPSPNELVEYAGALERLGALNESVRLLKSINGEHHPRALLYFAYCEIAQWNYGGAIPKLEQFLRNDLPTPYDKLVAAVNLAAALVYERRLGEGLEKCQQLIEHAKQVTSNRLRANLHEIRAQALLWEKKWEAAQKELETARELLCSENHDYLYVMKWQALIRCYRNPEDTAAFLELRKVRAIAQKKPDYETVRDCDRHESFLKKDVDLFIHLYFGTPHPALRQRLLEESSPASIPSTYDWTLQPGKGAAICDLSLADPSLSAGLKAGQLTYKLMRALSSDFYRPVSTTEIHNLLHPDDYFNPETTPLRVYQTISAARKWIVSSSLPFEIHEHQGSYEFRTHGPLVLRCPNPDANQDENSVFVRQLKERWGVTPFTTKEVSSFLKISPRLAVLRLRTACDSGLLSQEGQGRSTKYRASPPSSVAPLKKTAGPGS
ncbi:MAG: hypothetical protein KDD51_12705 [Bdellovibrionales bacterium]|nr:hypothetical protein [Bdellovibrionales bacterium]